MTFPIYFSIAEPVAPEILKKLLENYESERAFHREKAEAMALVSAAGLEKLEEFSQTVIRQNAESTSTMEWFMNKFITMWETRDKGEGKMLEILQGLLENYLLTSRHVDLRRFGEKLGATLGVSVNADPVPDPRQTRLTFPIAGTSQSASNRSPFPPLPPHINLQTPPLKSPKKRPAAVDESEAIKHRKTGS